MKKRLGVNPGNTILLDGVLQTANRGLALPGFNPLRGSRQQSKK
jgi:hypothetical protein